MIILSEFRRIVFWLVDFITGSKIRKAYNEIQQIYKTESSSIELKKYHQNKIKKLLNNASENCLFYSKYKSDNISDFPIINKGIIQQDQDSFFSKAFEGKKLITMSTSGSTGTPFTSYQNIDKKRRVNAETIFFNEKAGYKVGYPLINLRSLNIKSQKTILKQWFQNEKLIDVDKLAEKEVETLLKRVEKVSSKEKSTILSYASTYDAIHSYYKKNEDFKVNIDISGVISTSEILQDDTRDFIMNKFHCACYSRYANMENGMLGQDTPKHPNTFILNEANYYIEILKMDSDQLADFGEVGRIVVTDLYNYAMPMIRYENGDIGALTYIQMDGVKKKAITNFGGRKTDMIFDTSGNFVSPHKLSVSFWGIKGLLQFQFIQEEKNIYKVLLVTSKSFNDEKQIMINLKEILGVKAQIKIEFVKDIPVLASGKHKYIMNNYRQ